MRSRRLLAWIAPLVLVGGLALLGWPSLRTLEWSMVVAWAEAHGHTWWLPPALAAVMAGFLAFGLPGSVFIWVAGFLLPPLVATPVVLAGGVGGAAAAYALARGAGARLVPRARRERWIELMQPRGDFVTLVALRVAPGVPHAVVSFGAGLVEVPFRRYLGASIVGLVIKSSLYVTAIHRATHITSVRDLASWNTTAPLVLLTGILLLASQLRASRGFEPDPEPEA